MSSLIPFDFDSHPVRVLIKDDAPWFCLVDVCRALDLSRASSLVATLDKGGYVSNLSPTSSGVQPLVFIHEPNLYRLIFRSDKPEARRFQDWVFAEVLPAIRKTGEYRANPICDDDEDERYGRLFEEKMVLLRWLIGLKPEIGKIARFRRAGLTRVEVARALGWGEKRVRLTERKLAAAGLLPKGDALQLALLEG